MMNLEQKAIYAILHTNGIGNVKGRKIIDTVNKIGIMIEDIDSIKAQLCSVITNNEYNKICETISEIDFDDIENKLEKYDTRLITYRDKEYPQALYKLTDMPLILYCRGNIDLLKSDCFAVVGTRYPTKYGIRICEEFVAKLAERFCIVSGLARGIDSNAHNVTLQNMGSTIAVLGCGVDIVYPSENSNLYKEIIKNGLIISEYDIGMQANPYNFPARNRIISGLSCGILIPEAGEKSGSMITLEYAEKQGISVFCVPGSIYNKASAGCNSSIRECQTRVAVNVNDIYDELGLTRVKVTKVSDMQLDVNEDNILRALEKNGEMHFEELINVVDISVPQLNSLLIRMSAVGLINKTKFNYWSV